MNESQTTKELLFSENLYKSLSIDERAKLFSEIDKELTDLEVNGIVDNWKEKALLKDYSLDAKLNTFNLNKQEFAKILFISSKENWHKDLNFSIDHKPEWMNEIDKAFKLNRENLIDDSEDLNLSFAYRPFLLWARVELEEYFNNNDSLSKLVDWKSLLPSLMHNLALGLTQIGARTFVLEMHVCKKMNELKGDSSEERLNSFLKDKLLDPDYLEFVYSEYPVLARVLMIRTKFFINNSIEALERFSKDWNTLDDEFHLQGKLLSEISAELGDSHQQGKSVMKFKFNSKLEIIYKPKSLSLANNFGNLLEWFNHKGFSPDLKSYNIIHGKNYAWEEKIEYVSCSSVEEIKNYYKRLGGLLAILYIVRGTDFHSENLIAHGEYPILIDLETLFHPSSTVSFEPSAEIVAKEKIHNSVLGTALLPHLSFRSRDGKGIDLSGVSSTDKEMPIPILQIENYGNDNMRFVRKTITTKESDQNVPKINEEVVNAEDYSQEIVEGFETLCKIVINNKSELLSEDGIISKFKDDIIRIIIRPTQYYGDFISESSHPDYLTDWLERDKLLDRLWFTSLDNRTIPLEIKDIINNDIPMFFSTTNSLNLLSSTGEKVLDFYNKSSYQIVLERIKNLDSISMNEQSNWIKSSLLSNKKEEPYTIKKKSQFSENELTDNNLFINEAEKIGDKLLEQAILGKKNDATWISLDTNYYGQWHVSSLENGLYNGVGGIALFLTYLSKITKKDVYNDLANKAVESILNTPAYSSDFFSAFFGKASDIYVLSNFMSLNGENDRIREVIKSRINLIHENISKNDHYDLLGGSAGIIQVLLNAHEQINSTEALLAAKKYGEHLLENKTNLSNGVGWLDNTSKTCLGGLSHGNSGIAWSLLRLHKMTGEEKFLETALQALNYDRSLYNKNAENWEDLRLDSIKNQPYSTSWCHGATGIGLSRLEYLDYLKKDQLLTNEIDQAITTTEKYGMGRSHSLCHGDLGNSELFLNAGLKLQNQNYVELAQSVGVSVIEEKNKNGYYFTGISNNIELPGLFLGLSGIGYQLLRLAEPEIVPSVLTLEINNSKNIKN
ncbi:type 2 lanthipeptide synthetase LanM family protein [Jeotgalibacillus terrae]|uniref:Type 2 lanthipeptide synthetase LanM family protein n=1 Tax=Jeotgalibacillus terrae TaxID=587735 RepID=A0ABW5ZIP6_9BACL|nr:type 2 lanthipeptide synthetase LanM family protein [Jeotgalibacillus terrae]MBM7580805.1 type 2 lantibiotic biosynthesis protein LanM [Jeotgalibacillus terrae]